MKLRKAFAGVSWRSYSAEVLIWGLTAAAMLVNFWNVVERASSTDGLTGPYNWTALVFAALGDIGALVGFLLAREATYRGTPSWGAWVISIVCVAVSLQYNVAGNWGSWSRSEAIEARAFMPALAIFSQWWMLHGRSRKWSVDKIRGRFGRGRNVQLHVSEDATNTNFTNADPPSAVRVLSAKARQKLLENADFLPTRGTARANLIKRVQAETGASLSLVQRVARDLTREASMGGA
jgi:hypothetical protein